MKTIILTLFFLVLITASASAADVYNCTDANGNTVVTDTPAEGMKNCVLKDTIEPSTEKRARKAARPVSAYRSREYSSYDENEPEGAGKRKKYMSYCEKKRQECYNTNPDRRLCEALKKKCQGYPVDRSAANSDSASDH